MFSKKKIFLLAAMVALSLVGAPSARADYALLGTGFRLRFERRETREENQRSIVRLYVADGGYLDIAPSEIQGYEKEERPPAPSVPLAAKPAALPDLLATAGYDHGLDPALLKSMIAEESNFNPAAVSPKGARGLMQLMPGTATLLGVKDIRSAAENVQGGALYIRSLLERYGGDLAKALAAYNAGPGIVDRYRGIPPYAETQNYVRRVITRFNREKIKQGIGSRE